MSPFYVDERVTVHHGDALDVLATLPDCSVDAVVTDPPYGLEFMGREWDSFRPPTVTNRGGAAPGRSAAQEGRWMDVDYGTAKRRSTLTCDGCGKSDKFRNPHACPESTPWTRIYLDNSANNSATMRAFQQWCEQWATECLRVLKPGGHMLAFGGTRTWHRLTVAIEDAGFEIRDSIAWLYGSGFPKSLDVSKAIDRQREEDLEPSAAVARWLVDRMTERGVTRRQVTEHFDAANAAQQWTTWWTDKAVKPRVPRWEQWQELRRWLDLPDDMDAEVWRLNGRKGTPGEAFRSRPITQEGKGAHIPGEVIGFDQRSSTDRERRDIPHTDAARAWQGWGTALKPAFEPVVVARKPLAGTVAANVLAWGTGALNIDGCRVEPVPGDYAHPGNDNRAQTTTAYGKFEREGRQAPPHTAGRWPTNVVLDAHTADQLDQQTGTLTSGANPTRRGSDKFRDAYGEFVGQEECIPARGVDSGGGSRFFPVFRYEPKAPTHERPRVKSEGGGNGMQNYGGYKVQCCDTCGKRWPSTEPQSCGHDGWTWQEPLDRQPDTAAHPTVKPLDLMRWLVRLVTPPGGTVLDPFAGSGTTAEACIVEGLHCITIEREAAYLPLIVARLNKPIQMDLFGAGA